MGYSRRVTGRRQISQNANRKRGYIHDENRRRQLAEITYKDALEKTRVSGYGRPPIRGGIPYVGPGELELIHICMSLNKHIRNSSQVGPLQPGLDSISS